MAHSNMSSRQRAAKGKNLLVVCCGVDLSKIAMFRHVQKRLGLNIYCLEESQNRMAMGLAEEKVWLHIPCDIFNTMSPTDPKYIPSIMEIVDRAMVDYKISGFDGVMTIWDDAVGLSARIATALGLPTNPVQAIDISHDKSLTRQCLEQHGLPCPRNISIKECDATDDYIVKVTGHLEAPVIVKPGSGGSSIGVRKVTNLKDIVSEYRICLAVIKDALEHGELMGINMGDNAATDIVIEEFLDGDEVDVDVILHDGKLVYAQVMDDWDYQEPWFCELGCHFPSKHSKELRQQFVNAAIDVVKTIGLTTSVHHIELINDKKKGPTLVEVNPRMGGGPVYNFHKGAFGVDLLEEVVMAALGLAHVTRTEPYPPEGPEYARASCVTMVGHARKTGVITNDVESCLSLAKADPDVELAAAMSCKGDQVVGWDDGFPTDMGRIDVISSVLSIDQCIKKASHLLDDFLSRVEIEPSLAPTSQ